MARFEAQVALVTGAGSGIGSSIASRLGSEGAKVVIVDSDGKAGELTVHKLAADGVEARLEIGDVGEPDVARAAVAGTIQAWGRIDILVNNAGVGSGWLPIWETQVETLDRVYRTNLRGTFLFCREVVPHMMERDYGRIVNISSIAGKEGNPNNTPYSATKAAVIGLTKSLGKELARTGIRVNCVTPALVMTPRAEPPNSEAVQYMLERIPMGRAGKPEETAAMVAWLASAECSFSTGAVFDISGGRATY